MEVGLSKDENNVFERIASLLSEVYYIPQGYRNTQGLKMSKDSSWWQQTATHNLEAREKKYCITSHHITSYHVTLLHITPHHITPCNVISFSTVVYHVISHSTSYITCHITLHIYHIITDGIIPHNLHVINHEYISHELRSCDFWLIWSGWIIMRFVIPVVFYKITNVDCVYSSNTTIFIGRIWSIFYIM